MIATEVWYTIGIEGRHMLRLDRPMNLDSDGEEFTDIAEMCAADWRQSREIPPLSWLAPVDVEIYASADGPALGTCEVTIEMRPKFKARRIFP